MHLSKQTPIYGNIGILHPEGYLMFYGNDDKADWYLSRNLAFWVTKEPPVIQLNFTPNGPGHKNDNFYLQPRINICVVCGKNENLTRHHVIPHGIRKYFPDKFKNYSSYDILPLCCNCHEIYEFKASEFKKQLADKYNVKYKGYFSVNHNEHLNFLKFQGLLWNINNNENIPQNRKNEMKIKVDEYLQKTGLTANDLLEKQRKKKCEYNETFGSQIVKQLKNTEDFQNFIIIWRKHFSDVMNPQHMPKNWQADRIERNHHD